jgi:hypothetical protein
VRVVVASLVVIASITAGCARGIVHTMEAVDTAEVTLPAEGGIDPDAAAPVVDASLADAAPDAATIDPLACEATKTDEACFDCCDAKYPKAIDIWFDALDACCPDDECSDAEYEKCELAADDLCAKHLECAGLEACEEESGCWEKVSSER